MSIFDKSFRGAPRKDFKKALGDVKDFSYTNRTSKKEREKMEKELFPSNKGADISRTEVEKKIKELKKKKFKVLHHKERLELDKEINVLKKLLEDNARD